MLHLLSAMAGAYLMYNKHSHPPQVKCDEHMPPFIERASNYVQQMNLGIMRSLEANFNDADSLCLKETKNTNKYIGRMADRAYYKTGFIDPAEFY